MSAYCCYLWMNKIPFCSSYKSTVESNSRKIFWQRIESYLMGPQGLKLKGLRSYTWVSTDIFKVFCKSRKISVCAKCTLEKASTWVHAGTCNTQSSVMYTRLLVGAWTGWFVQVLSGMTIRSLGVYITVCAYQNKSLRLPKHIWFCCIGFTNFIHLVCLPVLSFLPQFQTK